MGLFDWLFKSQKQRTDEAVAHANELGRLREMERKRTDELKKIAQAKDDEVAAQRAREREAYIKENVVKHVEGCETPTCDLPGKHLPTINGYVNMVLPAVRSSNAPVKEEPGLSTVESVADDANCPHCSGPDDMCTMDR